MGAHSPYNPATRMPYSNGRLKPPADGGFIHRTSPRQTPRPASPAEFTVACAPFCWGNRTEKA